MNATLPAAAAAAAATILAQQLPACHVPEECRPPGAALLMCTSHLAFPIWYAVRCRSCSQARTAHVGGTHCKHSANWAHATDRCLSNVADTTRKRHDAWALGVHAKAQNCGCHRRAGVQQCTPHKKALFEVRASELCCIVCSMQKLAELHLQPTWQH